MFDRSYHLDREKPIHDEVQYIHLKILYHTRILIAYTQCEDRRSKTVFYLRETS